VADGLSASPRPNHGGWPAGAPGIRRATDSIFDRYPCFFERPVFFSPFIVPVVAMLAFAAVIIARGPIGKALARRIEGTTGDTDLMALRSDMESISERVADLEERLDFTERLLSQERERPKLEP